jgi:hypothetical protein
MRELETCIAERPAPVDDMAADDLAQAMTLIDRYIVAMLMVFETNLERSVLSAESLSGQTSPEGARPP